MRFTLRAGGFALVAALAAAVTLVRPDVAPQSGALAAAQPAALPTDLALVPADAVGFVHVRLADLWRNEVMDGFRKTWEKAGPKALAALDAQFVPAPSTISRGTAFVLLDDKKKPQAVGVLAFGAAFDPLKVVKAYLPNHTAEKAHGKTVYRSPDAVVEFYFPDDKHIVVGVDGSLDHYLAKAPAKDGPLAPALKLAASPSKVMVASADVSALPIPPDALKDVPAEALPILKAKQLTVAVDLGAAARLDVRAAYADDAGADAAEKAVKALAELGRAEMAKLKKELEGRLYDPKNKAPRPAEDLPEAIASVFATGAINRLDEALADPKFVTRDGAELALAVPLPKELLVTIGGLARWRGAGGPGHPEGARGGRADVEREQPQAARAGRPQLRERQRAPAAGHRGQGRQADPELAGRHPAVHRAGQRVQAVQAGRAVGQRQQEGVAGVGGEDVHFAECGAAG